MRRTKRDAATSRALGAGAGFRGWREDVSSVRRVEFEHLFSSSGKGHRVSISCRLRSSKVWGSTSDLEDLDSSPSSALSLLCGRALSPSLNLSEFQRG